MKILEVLNVNKKYLNKSVLTNISFDLEKGEILSITGVSGSGKSTLLKILINEVKKDSGYIFFKGKELNNLNNKIQLVRQNSYSNLNNKMRVIDILKEGMSILNIQNKNKKIYELLTMIKLDKKILSMYPKSLSGGNRQLVCILRAILCEPEILLLDEITSSLDNIYKNILINSLLELKKYREISIINVSHDISLVKFISKRVIFLKNGIISDNILVEELFNKNNSEYCIEILEKTLELERNLEV